VYKEFIKYCKQVCPQKSYWKDGELWTAIILGILSFFWLKWDYEIIDCIRNHLGDLLNIVGILFGFTLAALVFYIEAAGNWAERDKVQKVADLIIDRHVWTVLWLLFHIGFTIFVWTIGRYTCKIVWLHCLVHAGLIFITLYCGFQIFNHTLTVWWQFRNRKRFK
jgi:hypothetical protein